MFGDSAGISGVSCWFRCCVGERYDSLNVDWLFKQWGQLWSETVTLFRSPSETSVSSALSIFLRARELSRRCLRCGWHDRFDTHDRGSGECTAAASTSARRWCEFGLFAWSPLVAAPTTFFMSLSESSARSELGTIKEENKTLTKL